MKIMTRRDLRPGEPLAALGMHLPGQAAAYMAAATELGSLLVLLAF